MTEKTDKQIDQNKPQPLKGSLPDLFESFRRADISLPQAIIIAAILTFFTKAPARKMEEVLHVAPAAK